MKTKTLILFVVGSLMLFSCGPTQSGDVVILVVDDFAPPSNEDSTPLEEYVEDENCAISPDGQKFGSTGTSLVESTANEPHGVTVFNDLTQHDPTALFTPLPLGSNPNQGWLKQASIWEREQRNVIVVGVDTGRYTTSDISANIMSAITFFESGAVVNLGDGTNLSLDPASRFVINMSFAIVPCELVTMTSDTYDALLAQETDLMELKDALEALSPSIDPQLARQIVLMNYYYTDKDRFNEQDKLFSLLEGKSADPNIVLVASAGNLGEFVEFFPFPFAPAKWDFVVSVSSEDKETEGEVFPPCYRNLIAKYSNCGEIRMDGDDTTDQASNRGTSYAAPKFSLRIAIALLDDELSICAPGSTATSVFGYASENGDWRNLSYDEAFAEVCNP